MQDAATASGKTGKSMWTLPLEIVKTGIPIITLFLGYFIYGAQTDLQSRIDANGKVLSNQLAFQSALKEEFYKRRLTVYEKACKDLAAAAAALNNAGTATEYETQAFDLITRFDQLKNSNALYWSSGVQNGLDDFWQLGIEKLQERKWDDQEVNTKISKKIAALYDQMKTDLNVADLSEVMEQTK